MAGQHCRVSLLGSLERTDQRRQVLLKNRPQEVVQVLVCYPGKPGQKKSEGSSEPQNVNAMRLHPFDLGTLRWQKAQAERCAYLLIGDGLHQIQTQDFPDVQGISPEDVMKLRTAIGRC
jgi:hypothetical protein